MRLRLVFTLLVLMLFSHCNLRKIFFGDEGPLGTSTMSATIDGEQVLFSDIRPSMYFHFSVNAQSPQYNIRLCVGSGNVGQYLWTGKVCNDFSADTTASLNSMLAAPGIGGCTIFRSDNGRRLVEGTFSFMIIDTIQQDTIHVNDGAFTLYYPAEG